MSEERKASEILLQLEHELKQLTGYVKTIDFNLKLLLSRVNSSASLTADVTPVVKQVETPSPSAFSMPTVEAVGIPPLAFPSSPAASVVPKNQKTAKKVTSSEASSTKMPVQQRVIFPDGRNVMLANVEIYDLQNNLAKKTKTNSAGKWNATLIPGKYFVMVSKSIPNSKKPVEKRFEIEIPVSDAPIELDPVEFVS